MTLSFILIMDIIGTVAFAISGAMMAIRKKMDIFGVNILAITTATGGGVIRDIMATEMPYIFVKHIYASASLIGAILAACLWNVIGKNGAMTCGFVAVLVIRVLARHYRWNLPKLPDRESV